jgi:hypothetical protein
MGLSSHGGPVREDVILKDLIPSAHPSTRGGTITDPDDAKVFKSEL